MNEALKYGQITEGSHLIRSKGAQAEMNGGVGNFALTKLPRRPQLVDDLRTMPQYYLPMDISGRFGVRLRSLRHERNLTQLRMSIEFGIDRSYISDIERGRKAISLPMLEVIALGMEITLSDLLQDI